MNKQTLILQAEQILQNNMRDGFTIPTAKLYPFQWNWDSGFVALGLQHIDINTAITELKSLFSGQWGNGMVPHIIFHSETETTYFPNFDFWDTTVNQTASQQPKTSGISQPPVHGFVIEELWKNHRTHTDLKEFIAWIFPKILKSHKFYSQFRDPNKEGLFYIYHPWESGRDNSPIWDESLSRIQIEPGSIPNYKRKDTSLADASERPTSAQYDRYVYLLELGKKHRYDGQHIYEESPLIIQDIMMNSILVRSATAMINLGKEFKFDVSFFEHQVDLAKKHFDTKFWSEKLDFYVSFDEKENRQIEHKEIGGLVSLLSGIPSQEKAERLNAYLINLHNNGYALCPSFDVTHPLFDSKRYWRGPIWCQMNWMIYKGLKSYGFHATASIVKNDFLALVSRLGFYEYFEPQKDIAKGLTKGYGGDNFSWTAAITLDLIYSK